MQEFAGKSDAKNSVGKLRPGEKDNIKTGLKETGLNVLDWLLLSQDSGWEM